MKFLFVKTELCWPRSSGHDVHSYHMMKALVEIGHEVALTTLVPAKSEAVAGLNLCDLSTMPNKTELTEGLLDGLSWRQERFRSYWGVDEGNIQFIRDRADELNADVVVVVGMEVLPYLSAVEKQHRVWYAADEWVWHHLSLVKATRPKSWGHIRNAIIMGLYENSFASVINRAWVVSIADQRALKMVTGIANIDVVPNGVDADFFHPPSVNEQPYSCTFWGCLDFAPNVQSLRWFCNKVWPLVLEQKPEAKFHIYGFNPNSEVQQMADLSGVSVTPNVPDIRTAVAKHQLVVLPFQSGGGVKNKLLEAASMAKPIVCSPRACNGLNASQNVPFRVPANTPDQWVGEMVDLWNDPLARKSIGDEARSWVVKNHSWNASAEKAVAI